MTRNTIKCKSVSDLINYLIDMETNHPDMKFILEIWDRNENSEMTNELEFEYHKDTNTLELK